MSRVRGSWTLTACAYDASVSTAEAMCSVWNAPATESGTRRALAGGSSLSAASCSIVPAATTWPAPLTLAAVRPCRSSAAVDLVGVAAEDGGHAGRLEGRGVGHRPAALADQHHRLLGGDHAGAGGRRDLADAVPGGRADGVERVGRVREDLQRRHQPGGHQQRLGDRGVADRVGVGLGAVVHQVEPGAGREPAQPVLEVGELEPGTEEAGRLGALPGSNDDQHGSSLSDAGGRTGGAEPDEDARACL